MMTTGKSAIFPVCMRVSVSNNSSMVPYPPGSTTKPYEYFSSITLRMKK